MKKRVLVTGGNGFIGSIIAKKLSSAGYNVISISRHSGETVNSFGLDLTDGSKVIKFIKNLKEIDVVIHCAAIAHGELPPQSYTVSTFNSLIVENLIASFSNEQPHWIFLSSISVYGDSYHEYPIKMEHLPIPTDDYGIGKLRDEQLLIRSCEHLDILRLMPTYDSNHMTDIKKRVFIPKTNLRIKILPSPAYSLCKVDVVIKSVISCLNEPLGRRLHQIGDPLPTLQSELIKSFRGNSIIVPQLLFKFCLAILPIKIKILCKIRLLLRKLGMNNVYELGVDVLSDK